MEREQFNKILLEAGISDAVVREDLWRSRSSDDLDKATLRNAAKQTLRQFPSLSGSLSE